jgi:hypothetical protein
MTSMRALDQTTLYIRFGAQFSSVYLAFTLCIARTRCL